MSEKFPELKTTPIDALFDSSGVHPNTEGEAWQELLAADIVVGVDRLTRQEFRVFGLETVQQFLATGEPKEVSIFRVELDLATDDLARFCALMRLAQGRDGYRPPGQNYSLGLHLGCGGRELLYDDGSTGVVTDTADPYLQEARAADDARLREMVQVWRGRGVGRPVILFVMEGMQVQIPPTASAVAVLAFGPRTAHVMTAQEARKALKPFFRAQTSSLFRVPRWPESYWSVYVNATAIEVLESRFWADVPESERPRTPDPD